MRPHRPRLSAVVMWAAILLTTVAVVWLLFRVAENARDNAALRDGLTDARTHSRLVDAQAEALADQVRALGERPVVNPDRPIDPFPGPAGEPGAVGLMGPVGPQGLPGIDGQDGRRGPQGRSIRGIAGQSIQGSQGEPGVDGQDGATGPAGTAGPAGPAGADGQDGTNGTDGRNGQPVASFMWTDPGTPAEGDDTTYTCRDGDSDGAYECQSTPATTG